MSMINTLRRLESLRTIRNRVEWKSDNYGTEEPASIQKGRRRHAMGGSPYTLVVDKNPVGISQELGVPAQGSSAREIRPHNFWQ